MDDQRAQALAFATWVLATGGTEQAISGRLTEYKRRRDAGETFRQIVGLPAKA